MDIRVVTSVTDPLAGLLKQLDLQAPLTIISEGETADPCVIAFTSLDDSDIHWPNRHVRMPPFQIPDKHPQWARHIPFTVGVRGSSVRRYLKGSCTRHDASLPMAIQHAVKDYACWVPGGRKQTPWHMGGDTQPNSDTIQGLQTWLAWVREVYTTKASELAMEGLTPIWGDRISFDRALEGGHAHLVVMGCAPFNEPHTDVARRLLAHKVQAVSHELERIIRHTGPWTEKIEVVVVGADFVGHPALKASLHPFFWPALHDLESKLGVTFDADARLNDARDVRTDDDVAEALEFGFRLIEREMITPLRRRVNLPIAVSRWTTAVPARYFDDGWAMVHENPIVQGIISDIYTERVKLRPWYRTVQEAMGHDAGLGRTAGNVAIYLGLALWLRDNPTYMLVDTEVDDQFWRRLSPILLKIWGSKVPFIGHVCPNARQPWAY